MTHTGKPMIENSDRGITLNKSLAWTIGSGLIGAGLYVGLSMATLTTRMDEVSRMGLEAAAARAQIESRVRVLETSSAHSGAQFEALYQSLQELKTDQRESNQLLRQILNDRQIRGAQ